MTTKYDFKISQCRGFVEVLQEGSSVATIQQDFTDCLNVSYFGHIGLDATLWQQFHQWADSE